MGKTRRLEALAGAVLLVGCSAAADKSRCGDGVCDSSENASTCAVDCASSCADPVCDLWPQCGCDGGQKCSLDGALARACVAAGAVPHGGTCTSDAECVGGAVCVTGSLGWCSQFCNATGDCPPGVGSDCVALDGGASPESVCTVPCSLLSPTTACGAGNGCEVVTGLAGTATDCAPAGSSTGACTTSSDCAPGRFCNPGPDVCTRWCDVDTGSPCVGAEACYPFSVPIIIGGVEYGGCI